MYCPQCGQLNEDGAGSCQKCGAVLPDGATGAASVPPTENATKLYAGFWKRLAAFILDYVILTAIFIFTGAVVGLLVSPDSASEGADTVSGIVGAVIWWLYYAIMESGERQATLGKIAVRIKVVDRQGGRISFARATGRHFAKLLSSLILFIGYLMAAFTSRKQALHDMVAGCLVVNRAASDEQIGQHAPILRN